MRRVGVAEASLSAIADEAGLAIGSVRHYFPNHDAILLFAMNELGSRVSARFSAQLERVAHDDVALPDVEAMLAELLPLDEDRRVETEVWLSFVAASRTRPALAEVAATVSTGIRAVIGRVLAGAQRRGLIEIGDLDLETERTTAVLDGLALAVVLPPHLPADIALTTLRMHIGSLRRPRECSGDQAR